jgi:branched-chain amino acid transport system ATP-binding protein
MWNAQASNLSGGQMKLLEMGRALMSGAQTLLLDEPISGVNPTLAHEIFQKILGLRDSLGLTFLIVEHRLDIALSYVDSVVAMAYGKLLAEGKPEPVMTDPRLIEAYLGG